ncbi:MAG: hypothetical protein JHC33_09720 [Ignisphaera sp.]|nr:hypothetical protein [Ignisphaera sp.]
MLDIELLDSIYEGRVNLDPLVFKPRDDEDLVTNFLPSKLWRMNNLYSFVDKEGEKRRFSMNYAQHRVYSHLLVHSRLIILKSRQQGISTFFLISYLDDLIFNDTLTIGMMAQGEKEAKTLLRRVKLAWNEFPESVKSFLQLKRANDNTQELSISNGSTMLVSTSFRSMTLQRLHISEFGKIANENPSRAQETITGTLQAIKPGNPVAIESTAEGDNLFKYMWDTAVQRLADTNGTLGKQDFYPVFLSWLDDPDCNSDEEEIELPEHTAYFDEVESETGRVVSKSQRAFWIGKYRELGGKVKQEYPATPDEAFAKSKDGTYYARDYKQYVKARGREIPNLYDANLPVHVAIDLGMSDLMVLLFFQVFQGEVRIIHEYYNSGEGLEFYVNYMNRIANERGYELAWVVGPHDLAVTELTSGKSRKARLHELGITKLKVLERHGLADGIELTRAMLPHLFVDSSCTYTIGCINNYTKEWDEMHEVWKAKPVHDKWSHGADVVRYIALAGFQNIPFYWETNGMRAIARIRDDFNDSGRANGGFAI